MAEEGSEFNVASVVEEVLQQHGKKLSDIDFASRKAQEASLRRYEAGRWLRKMVGVVLGKDLPAEPSDEDFRIGLRSGIILCNVLNKVQPCAIPKIVEAPCATVIIPDGAALTAYQYFENVRNFLVAIQEMGIPTFEVSDLEPGGKSCRIVNCVLALKSYHERKQSCGGNSNLHSAVKPVVRKGSDLFLNFISRNSSAGDKSLIDTNSCGDHVEDLDKTSGSLQMHVRQLLSDKNAEDIPLIVENVLSKVMEKFRDRLASQNEHIKTTSEDKGTGVPNSFTTEDDIEIRTTSQHKGVPSSDKTPEKEITTTLEDTVVPTSCTGKIETSKVMKEKSRSEKDFYNEASRRRSLMHQEYVIRVQELKNTLRNAKEDMQMLQLKYQEEVNALGKHLYRMASAAAGYQKVLEDNRKLYNQVQDLKGNIRVYCRVRPFLPGQRGSSIVEDIVESTLTIQTPSKHGKGKKAFTFNKAFGPYATQEEVFADTQPLIRSVLDGYNVCIFAYGQTGSGKTYTMTGPKELTKESLGVNYRALSDLFLISEQRKDTISYDISVQMMEIYNEQVRDLLVTDGANKKLEIRNNSLNGINVPNANLVPVTSTADVINLMNLGHKNRAVGSTSMNDRSSRSHSCLTVHIQGRELASGTVIRGCMHLVDLAGSERCDKTDAVGDRLKEAQHINRSLSALGDVISALAQKNAHVPYRNSKLTQLLQDSLGGQAKTLMFVHISPEPDALGETISTLKFAERVSTIELGAARSNKETSNSSDVKELKEQIAALKAALARKEGGDLGTFCSPDRHRTMSSGSSPSHSSSWNSKAEAQSYSSSRRHSLDSQDLSMNSPPWPSNTSIGGLIEDEKGVSGRQGNGRESPVFYQKHNHDTSKLHKEQPLNKISEPRRHSLDYGVARTSQYQAAAAAAADDSDPWEVATSESSEPDYQWQLNIHKSNSLPSVVGSKLRKPTSTPKHTKSQEMRSQIPQPTGRLLNGVHSLSNKNLRQPSVVGRRKPAGGK